MPWKHRETCTQRRTVISHAVKTPGCDGGAPWQQRAERRSHRVVQRRWRFVSRRCHPTQSACRVERIRSLTLPLPPAALLSRGATQPPRRRSAPAKSDAGGASLGAPVAAVSSAAAVSRVRLPRAAQTASRAAQLPLTQSPRLAAQPPRAAWAAPRAAHLPLPSAAQPSRRAAQLPRTTQTTCRAAHLPLPPERSRRLEQRR